MSRMAIPFCMPHDEREEEVQPNEVQPERPEPERGEYSDEGPDYDSPDEDTGQQHYEMHYQRLQELIDSLYNVFRIALLPPPPMPRRQAARNSGRNRRQQVGVPAAAQGAAERDPAVAAGVAADPRGAVPRPRRQRSSAGSVGAPATAPGAAAVPAQQQPPPPAGLPPAEDLIAAAVRSVDESDGDGDGLRLRELAAEARRRAGRRRLSSRTVATETDEEPPRGSVSNCQLAGPAVAASGARRSMSTSSTQCSYEDWAGSVGGGDHLGGRSSGGGGADEPPMPGDEEDDPEEEEDDVFVASRPGDAHPPPRPPSPPPPPPSSNPRGGGGGSRGGSVQSNNRQKRRRSGGGSSSSGGGSSSSGGRKRGAAEGCQGGSGEAAPVCTDPATPLLVPADREGGFKMAPPRKVYHHRKESWDAVDRELRKVAWQMSSTFKQVDKKTFKKVKDGEKGASLSNIFSPLMPSASPGLWALVAVCVGAQVMGRLW